MILLAAEKCSLLPVPLIPPLRAKCSTKSDKSLGARSSELGAWSLELEWGRAASASAGVRCPCGSISEYARAFRDQRSQRESRVEALSLSRGLFCFFSQQLAVLGVRC